MKINPMHAFSLQRAGVTRVLGADALIVAGLTGLDVGARLLPHAPNFTPVAATALFAASVLRIRALAVLVPIAGMMLGDLWFGGYDIRIMIAVYATLVLPASAGALSRTLRRPLWTLPVLASSSLIFFVVTNFVVWAFGAMYPANAEGLLTCYVAGLPFLRNMLTGDLFWGLVLFGGYWLLQGIRADGTDTASLRIRH
jgi:hypothetical protein